MTTFSTLRTNLSAVLRDTSNVTFSDTEVGVMVNRALAEIGRIAPARFTEDITPVADTAEYTLRSSTFSAAVPEITLVRVEIWDMSVSPEKPLKRVAPGDMNYNDSGWYVWDGVLYLPYWVPVYLDGYEASYSIRVWGYSPYKALSADADVVPLSTEREYALYELVRLFALEALNADRVLFVQWQTASNNTDVTPAGLLSQLNLARDAWRRTARNLYVPREVPG